MSPVHPPAPPLRTESPQPEPPARDSDPSSGRAGRSSTVGSRTRAPSASSSRTQISTTQHTHPLDNSAPHTGASEKAAAPGGESDEARPAGDNSEAPAASHAAAEAAPERPFSAHSGRHKWLIVGCAAFASLASPISSVIVVPCLNALAGDFGESIAFVTLSLTVYILFQAVAPAFVASLSDSFGRRPVIMSCTTVYIAACIGLATVPATTFGGFLGLRVMQAIGGSPLIAIGAGCVSDIATTKERGKYMGLYTGVAMIGPAFGPTLGGIFNQTLGWRAVFWFCAIFVGVTLLVMIFTLPETLRALVGDGTIPPPPICRRPQDAWRIRQRRRERERHPERRYEPEPEVERPPKKRYDPLGSFKAFLQPDVAALLLFAGMMFATMYAVLSTLSVRLEDDYGFSTIESGLCYIPLGMGALVTALYGGRVLDWDLSRTMRRAGFVQQHPRDLEGFAIERCRCHFLPISYGMMMISMILYGWSLHAHWSFVVPLLLGIPIGVGNQFTMQVCGVLLVDLFPEGAGAITASFNLARCLLAAAVTAFINPLEAKVGLGWALVTVCAMSVAFSPALVYVVRRGPEERARRVEEGRAREERRGGREKGGI